MVLTKFDVNTFNNKKYFNSIKGDVLVFNFASPEVYITEIMSVKEDERNFYVRREEDIFNEYKYFDDGDA